MLIYRLNKNHCSDRDCLLTEVEFLREEIQFRDQQDKVSQTPLSVLINNMIKEKYAERLKASGTDPERDLCVNDYIGERMIRKLDDADFSTSLLMLASATTELRMGDRFGRKNECLQGHSGL